MKVIKTLKYSLLLVVFFINYSFGQEDYSVIKGQFALGLNAPSQNGFVKPFEGKGTNFPTINLGLQYMFKAQLGAKLDFGYNRMSNGSDSPEFKLNYTRINAQFVYDLTPRAYFLPVGTGLVLHAGPGYSMVKPLAEYGENKTSFLNAMAGFEFHYTLTRTTSVYFDTSYIYSFAGDFDPVSEGFGSFNGNVLTVTVGLSLSLSGCRTCN
jgi:hypothetical protein